MIIDNHRAGEQLHDHLRVHSARKLMAPTILLLGRGSRFLFGQKLTERRPLSSQRVIELVVLQCAPGPGDVRILGDSSKWDALKYTEYEASRPHKYNRFATQMMPHKRPLGRCGMSRGNVFEWLDGVAWLQYQTDHKAMVKGTEEGILSPDASETVDYHNA